VFKLVSLLEKNLCMILISTQVIYVLLLALFFLFVAVLSFQKFSNHVWNFFTISSSSLYDLKVSSVQIIALKCHCFLPRKLLIRLCLCLCVWLCVVDWLLGRFSCSRCSTKTTETVFTARGLSRLDAINMFKFGISFTLCCYRTVNCLSFTFYTQRYILCLCDVYCLSHPCWFKL